MVEMMQVIQHYRILIFSWIPKPLSALLAIS